MTVTEKNIWISTDFATFLVGVDEDNVIIEAPPVVSKFIGKSLEQLIGWVEKVGKYIQIVPLGDR